MGGWRHRRRRDAASNAPRSTDAPASVWFDLGLVRQDLRDHDKAAAAYRKALEKKPDYAEAALNLGIVLQETGDLDSAMGAYAEAYRLRPQTLRQHRDGADFGAPTAACGWTRRRCAAHSAAGARTHKFMLIGRRPRCARSELKSDIAIYPERLRER